MTTAAAIDRVVHHSVVLELSIESYRAEVARSRVRPEGGDPKHRKGGTERTVLEVEEKQLKK